MDDELQAAIAGAEAYQDLHVPALFSDWPERVLDSGLVAAGHRVLDVACGTGVLAVAAQTRVGSSGQVAGVDLSPGMLTVARRLSKSIDWIEGSAGDLPFEAGEFDRVVSQFGIMFFPDREQAVREMLRVLVPSGKLSIAAWASLDESPAYAIAVSLLNRLAGADAAAALSVPFDLGDRSLLERIAQNAGAQDVRVASAMGRASFPSIKAMMEAELRGWLPVMGVILAEESIAEILAVAERELAQFVNPEGRVEFDAPANILSASK